MYSYQHPIYISCMLNLQALFIRNPDEDEVEKNLDENASRKALMQKSIDTENHNELTDLIQEEENTSDMPVDTS